MLDKNEIRTLHKFLTAAVELLRNATDLALDYEEGRLAAEIKNVSRQAEALAESLERRELAGE